MNEIKTLEVVLNQIQEAGKKLKQQSELAAYAANLECQTIITNKIVEIYGNISNNR